MPCCGPGLFQWVDALQAILTFLAGQQRQSLSDLLDIVSDLVWKYEQQNHAIEPALPKDVLRFLTEARALKQADLSALVPQGNLSAILAGKRKISAALAARFAKFFGVSAAVFVAA